MGWVEAGPGIKTSPAPLISIQAGLAGGDVILGAKGGDVILGAKRKPHASPMQAPSEPHPPADRVTGRVMQDHHVELGFHALLSLPNGKTKCTIPLAAKVLMV